MRVLIIGSGNMGRGIGTRLLAGGNDVTMYDLDPQVSAKAAAELKAAAKTGTVQAASGIPGAARDAEVVVLASWYGSNLEVAKEHGAAFAGKVVVDISNPLNETYDGLVTAPGTSAAETIRAALPAGTRVVKAFNTTFAGTLMAGSVAGQTLDVFVAGDDRAAKDTVIALVRGAGMNAVDAGTLERARQLEGLALLGITLQGPLGTGFMSGWRLVVPKAA